MTGSEEREQRAAAIDTLLRVPHEHADMEPRFVTGDAPGVAGEYLGWVDPDIYGPASGWQHLNYNGSQWFQAFGNMRLVVYPSFWMPLPPEPAA